ncbi:MAG: hypothetical protein ACPGYV_14955, partial [Phycisphaeraceae bacterium]
MKSKPAVLFCFTLAIILCGSCASSTTPQRSSDVDSSPSLARPAIEGSLPWLDDYIASKEREMSSLNDQWRRRLAVETNIRNARALREAIESLELLEPSLESLEQTKSIWKDMQRKYYKPRNMPYYIGDPL